MENYCPISVLPCFSNIFEKIICDRPYFFFFKINILYETQFGFQKQTLTGTLKIF